jgi:hypothetical protein
MPIKIDGNTLDKFREYLNEHYGAFKFGENFMKLKVLLDENAMTIKDKNMEFQELTKSINEYIKKRRSFTIFSYLLNEFKTKKGVSHIDIYKKAYIDRRVYSRLIKDRTYHPGKRTVISLGLALELTRDDMDEFLASAGFCFNSCSVFDLVIMFCIDCRIYDINTVNALLVEVGEKVLHKE